MPPRNPNKGIPSMRWSTILLAVVAAAPAALVAQAQAPDSGVQRITLSDAIQRALEVQPAMVQALGNQRNTSAAGRAAVGSFLPTLGVSLNGTHQNATRVNSQTGGFAAPDNYTAGLSASLNLFTGLSRAYNLKVSSANNEAADAGVNNQRYLTMLQTAQTFYAVIADVALVHVGEVQLQQAQQQLDISTQKLRAGSATRSDSLTSAVAVGNARLVLLQAQSNLATAEATLGRQIGLDTPVLAVADTGLPALPDTTPLRDEAMKSAPVLVQAEASARAARANEGVARAQYFPTLTLRYNNSLSANNTFSFLYDQASCPQFQCTRTYGWSLGLSWTLFNGLSREQSMVSASVSRDVAEAQAADTRRQVNEQFTQYVSALNTAWTQIDIANSNVTASTEALRVQNERYKVGAGILLDVLTAQSNLTTAQVSLVQARFNYLIARAQLAALVGHLL